MSAREVIVLTSDPGGPVVRHRWLAYERELAAMDVDLNVATWPKCPVARRDALKRIDQADAVVVSSRLLTRRDVGRVRKRARRMAFDFDDALSFRDSARGATKSGNRAKRFAALVRASDRVIAGNAYLADLAVQAGGRATVLPTTVEVLADAPAPQPAADQHLTVGWIGSPATRAYLQSLCAPWAAATWPVPARLRVIADQAPTLPGIDVEFVPWTRATWRADLAATHFGVAPLPDDAWTRGKCGLKVLQMLACGRPVVASPVGVQADQVLHEQSGVLASTPDEFAAALSRLARDHTTRQAMGAVATQDAQARWSVAAWKDAVCSEVEALLS